MMLRTVVAAMLLLILGACTGGSEPRDNDPGAIRDAEEEKAFRDRMSQTQIDR